MHFFLGNSPVLGRVASSVLAKSPIWTYIIAANSVYCINHFLSFPSLMHPVVVSTQDKRHICTDDPDRCKFESSHPASLLRHRKHRHNYKTGSHTKSWASTAPTASSSSGTPFSVESSFKSFSPASPLPSQSLLSTSSPSFLFPLQVGESETTSSSLNDSDLNSVLPPADSFHSPPHKDPKDFFNSSPPCSYNYACDTSFRSGFDFLAAEPNMEQFDILCNDPSIYPLVSPT